MSNYKSELLRNISKIDRVISVHVSNLSKTMMTSQLGEESKKVNLLTKKRTKTGKDQQSVRYMNQSTVADLLFKVGSQAKAPSLLLEKDGRVYYVQVSTSRNRRSLMTDLLNAGRLKIDLDIKNIIDVVRLRLNAPDFNEVCAKFGIDGTKVIDTVEQLKDAHEMMVIAKIKDIDKEEKKTRRKKQSNKEV